VARDELLVARLPMSSRAACQLLRFAPVALLLLLQFVGGDGPAAAGASRLVAAAGRAPSRRALARAPGARDGGRDGGRVGAAPGGGRWVHGAPECDAYPWACSHGWRWDDGRPFLTPRDACSLLVTAGISKFVFVGDSFVRQLYQATKILLEGEAERVSMDGYAPPACRGEGAFSVSDCRQYIQLGGAHCGGRVYPRLKYAPFPLLLDDDNSGFIGSVGDGDAVVWGVGSHPRDFDYKLRKGINNASYISNDVFRPHCRERAPAWLNASVHGRARSKVFWLPPHARQAGGLYADEAPAVIRAFARESAVEVKRMCNIDALTEPYELTAALAERHPALAANSSYDGQHWGRAVNVMKAQAVLWAVAGAAGGKTWSAFLGSGDG